MHFRPMPVTKTCAQNVRFRVPLDRSGGSPAPRPAFAFESILYFRKGGCGRGRAGDTGEIVKNMKCWSKHEHFKILCFFNFLIFLKVSTTALVWVEEEFLLRFLKTIIFEKSKTSQILTSAHRPDRRAMAGIPRPYTNLYFWKGQKCRCRPRRCGRCG